MIDFAQFDVSKTELKVLRGIAKAARKLSPTSPSTREIAKASGVCLADTHKHLKSLEAKRFIRRERKQGSEKKKYRGTITVTDKGQLVLMAAERKR